jgi:ribosome-associated heat shock protein Hsp15
MEKTRIDKWLWSVRIFKTRTIAADACKNGRVKLQSKPAKASSLIMVGEIVEVKKEGFNLKFKVEQIIEKRVGAPIAEKCYTNITPVEELNKYTEWFIGKSQPEFREKGAGRPTKKERREIDEFKDYQFTPDE